VATALHDTEKARDEMSQRVTMKKFRKVLDKVLFVTLVAIPVLTYFSIFFFIAAFILPFGSYTAVWTFVDWIAVSEMHIPLFVSFALSVLMFFQCAAAVRKQNAALPAVTMLILVFDILRYQDAITRIPHHPSLLEYRQAFILSKYYTPYVFDLIVIIMIVIYLMFCVYDRVKSSKDNQSGQIVEGESINPEQVSQSG
jgi:hypothetical protein